MKQRFDLQFKNEEKTYTPLSKTLKAAKMNVDYIKNYKWLTYEEEGTKPQHDFTYLINSFQ